ncbi:sigma factor-like helix-turn-helix DNA-binding protein [Ructibacterium gallinarum]|uniref:sigma factor-like helix-turn-helix DNA-binding protein n=1 Tax=Ructibacterium gallinarum TaxID=2779355 RepID=UPI001CF815AA|nr:sigma factor-like helix-turn-helix DNA-binding protein [Ructibacterium gallinarum]DAY68410.1 MAG TPA: RNA polymerase sigma factor [Caudoviricetes sp.]
MRLKEQEKQKVLTLYCQGLGYRRIAVITGISPNTIKSYCQRHLAKNAKACKQCGRAVRQMPHRKEKQFCSDRCRMKWWNAHPSAGNRKAYYSLICKYCGREFESYGNNKRKFCSRHCYDLSRKGVTGNA